MLWLFLRTYYNFWLINFTKWAKNLCIFKHKPLYCIFWLLFLFFFFLAYFYFLVSVLPLIVFFSLIFFKIKKCHTAEVTLAHFFFFFQKMRNERGKKKSQGNFGTFLLFNSTNILDQNISCFFMIQKKKFDNNKRYQKY